MYDHVRSDPSAFWNAEAGPDRSFSVARGVNSRVEEIQALDHARSLGPMRLVHESFGNSSGLHKLSRPAVRVRIPSTVQALPDSAYATDEAIDFIDPSAQPGLHSSTSGALTVGAGLQTAIDTLLDESRRSNATEETPSPSFALPKGVPPVGVPMRSVYEVLLAPTADTAWVHQSCVASNDEHLRDRFAALLRHGPYVLYPGEAHQSRHTLTSYLSTPFESVDTLFLHFLRLFMCTKKPPLRLKWKSDALHFANGAAALRLRNGDPQLHNVVLIDPEQSRARARPHGSLRKWKLNELDVIFELILSSGTVSTITIDPPGCRRLMHRAGELIEGNANIQNLSLCGPFQYDTLRGVALGLDRLVAALDSDTGTARLVKLSLSAACDDEKLREQHRAAVAQILVRGAAHCETLSDVSVRRCSRSAAFAILPAVSKLILTSRSLTHLRLTDGCVLSSKAAKGGGGHIGRGPALVLADAVAASHLLSALDLSRSRIADVAAARGLANAVYNAPALVEVTLADVRLPNMGRLSVLQALSENGRVDESALHLRNFASSSTGKVPDSTFLALSETVHARCETLAVLSLAGFGLGKKGATSLAAALRSCFCLSFLDISNNNIESTGANNIIQALRHSTSLVRLFMGSNRIGDGAAHGISALLQVVGNSLQELHLAENIITNDGASLIWSVISRGECPALLRVDFSGNKLDSCWPAVQALRKDASVVSSISLARNKLAGSASNALAEAIEHRWSAGRYLAHLDVSGNPGMATTISAIGHALAHAEVLVSLKVGSCNLGVLGTSAIMTGLAKNRSVTSVDVSGNLMCCNLKTYGLELTAVRNLCKCIETNPVLTEIDVSSNQLGTSGGHLLRTSLESSRLILSINASDNELDPLVEKGISAAVSLNRKYDAAGLRLADFRV
eukprot:g1694.t1